MKAKITYLKPFGVLVEPLESTTHVSELEVSELKKIFYKEQLVVLRGFKTFKDSDEFSDYSEAWGKVSLWPFGKVLKLIEQDKAQDHIFDNSYMPLHWDGMYRPHVPEFQVFHCVKAPKPMDGGRTTFSNTKLVLKNTSKENIDTWTKVIGIYEREMEFYKSRTVSPIITKHPFDGSPIIRYNEPPLKSEGVFINPSNLEFKGCSDESAFHKSLREALYDSNCFYAHEWRDRDIVIADNFSLLHGREKFRTKCSRHIERVHALSEIPYENPALESHE